VVDILGITKHFPSFGTYVKIGTIQRRLAWPLRKDDTLNIENGPNFFLDVRERDRKRELLCKCECVCVCILVFLKCSQSMCPPAGTS